MDLEDKDFLDFAKYSHELGIRYLIIGGFAMYLNGIKRNTEDVDIWIEPTNECRDKLMQVFLDLGYSIEELSELAQFDFTQTKIFSALGHLDFLTNIHRNFKFEVCFAESKEHILTNNIPCRFLHINHLRESKILARREQDLRDVILIDNFLKLNQ